MVINDDFTCKQNSSPHKNFALVKNIYSASPLDRIASFIIDYFIILSPLITLFTAPFKKQLGLSGLVYGEIDSQIIYLNILVIIFLLSFLYNLLFTYFLGSTLGQLFLGLKVGTIIKNNKLGVFEVFVRSAVYNFSLLLLGLPFLFSFTHKGRRSIHDLLSDTFVYSIKEKKVSRLAPVFISRSLVSIVSVFIVFGSLLIIQSLISENTTIGSFDSESELCEEVTKAAETWPEQNEVQPKRLSIAMALFAIEEIDKDCLEIESTYVFDSGEEAGLAYLANAFIYADQPSLSDKYLEKVCQLDLNSETCKMASVIDHWAMDRLGQVGEILNNLVTDSVYVNLWKTRFLLSEGLYDQSLATLSKLPKLSILSSFSSINKVKLFWYKEKYEQASLVSDMVYEKENPSESKRLSSWLCFEELEKNCESVESTSCQVVELNSSSEEGYAGLAMLKKLECSQQLQTYYKYNWDPEVFSLINFKLEAEKKDLNDLTGLISTDFTQSRLSYEAISTFLKLNPDVNTQMLSAFEDWTSQLSESFRKTELAGKIMNYLVKEKKYEQALEYGEKFLTKNSSIDYQKNLVVSAYFSHKKLKAKFYFDLVESESKSRAKLNRTIAGTSDFDKVKAIIEKGHK